MKTKIFLFLLIISLTGSMARSQETRFGVFGGVNFQNINGKDQTGNKLENTLLPGYHAGVNVYFPIAEEIGFQPGVMFSSKGSVFSEDPETKYRIGYIEVPLNLVYRGQLGNNFVLLGFGPYASFALMGNLIVGDVKTDLEFDNDITVWNPLVVRRFDAGANIFAGYELGSGLFFTLNTQLGLLNISPDASLIPDDERSWKNTGFGLSVGFRF